MLPSVIVHINIGMKPNGPYMCSRVKRLAYTSYGSFWVVPIQFGFLFEISVKRMALILIVFESVVVHASLLFNVHSKWLYRPIPEQT